MFKKHSLHKLLLEDREKHTRAALSAPLNSNIKYNIEFSIFFVCKRISCSNMKRDKVHCETFLRGIVYNAPLRRNILLNNLKSTFSKKRLPKKESLVVSIILTAVNLKGVYIWTLHS